MDLALSLCVVALFLGAVGMLYWRLRKIEQQVVVREHPCYRCRDLATEEFRGLHYCRICRDVVMMTSGVVAHDPPFGYPGSPGYLEFPRKKEAS